MNVHVLTRRERSLPRHDLPLDTDELLPQVETFMGNLVLGQRVNEAGTMAYSQISSGGKRVRARLALQACRAFKVDDDSAIAWAAAIEILHNATLIHDDIQDGDTTRRGKPTIWARYGLSQAINAGDLLLMMPFLALTHLPLSERGLLSGLIAEYATLIVRGQAEEISLKHDRNLEMATYLEASEGKTGALLALPVVGAAVLGGRCLADAQRLAAPFVQLGVLFQLQDDLIDMFGDKGRKEIGGDIYEGKVSALLVAQRELAPGTQDEILSILEKPRAETTEADVERVKFLYIKHGARERVIEQISIIRKRVLHSTLLRQEPSLQPVAEKLVDMALEPIFSILESTRP